MPRVERTCIVGLVLGGLVCALSIVRPAPAQQNRRAAEPPRALTRLLYTKQNWTVHAEVTVLSGRPGPGDVLNSNPNPFFLLSSVEVAYPVIPDTASSIAERFRLNGELWVANVMRTNEPRIIDGYQGLSSIAIWSTGEIRSQQLTLKVNIASSCYETRINERVARAYTWPEHPWNAELSLCLDPQLFVEVQDPAVQELTRNWTQGKPRAARPYDLAKHLAAQTLAHFRRTQGLYETTSRNPGVPDNAGVVQAGAFFSGFRVNGAAYTARTGEGSFYDLACLLTAVYRAAGIPARMVIGYDIERSDADRLPVLRAWVEFFLARDPVQPVNAENLVPVSPADGEWIPVDISRQQEFSSRAPPLNQRWQFFGHNEELDLVPPIAFHWLPPSTLTNAGAAAIWGWLPQPANPVADQEVRFWYLGTPQRGDDPKPDQR